MSSQATRPKRRRQSNLDTRRVIGLTRFSQLGQRDPENLKTTDEQRARLAAACDIDPELNLIGIIDERKVSGRAPLEKRIGLSEALRMIEDDEADDLMVAYFDRAFRSGKVKTEVVDRVEAAGGRLLTLDMGAISHATAAQWVTSGVMTLVAEYVARSAAERTAGAQEAAIREGKPIMPTVTPGYVKGADGCYIIDKSKSATMHEAFRMRADGTSYREVREYLRDRGINYSLSGVTKLLRSRVYRGEVRFGEHVNLTAHNPIVSEDLWRAAQRGQASRGRRPMEDRLLSRLRILRCGTCNARMSRSTVKVDGKRYAFYRCEADDCTRRAHISCNLADGATLDELRRLADTERWQGRATIETNVEEARVARDIAQAALERTARTYAASGIADEPFAVEELAKLRRQRDAAEDHHDRLASAARVSVTVTIGRDLDRMLLDEQRALVAAVFERIVVTPGRGAGRLAFHPFLQQPPGDAVKDPVDTATNRAD